MQILYVSVMVCIFVLCLALLATARRVLQSTPLTGGRLSISTDYDLDGAQPEALAGFSADEDAAPAVHTDWSTPGSIVAEPVLAQGEPILARAEVVEMEPPSVPAQAMEPKPLFTPLPPIVQAPTPISAPKKTPNLLPVKKAIRMRKPSRRVYNYAFECLLLGVSAVVLIKTQRGVMRYRGSHPSVA